MTNPTTPFSWQMPTSVDLVTDLPADFEVFGQAVATSMADLLGGTTGQILSKTSNTDMDFTWITNVVGDITAVTAGSGLSGGGTSGAVSLALDLASANVFTAAQTATRFIVTGSTIATNGMYLSAANTLAFSTNSTLAMQINATGEIGLGTTSPSLARVAIGGNSPSGGGASYGLHLTNILPAGASSVVRNVYSNPSTIAGSYTIPEFRHFEAVTVTLGASSAVTNQYGFLARPLSGATSNFGFASQVVSAANAFNFYASGTATNYFGGRTGVGIVLTSTAQFAVTNLQGTGEVTVLTRNFAAQTAESLNIQNSASSLIFGVTAAGLMKYISGNTATTVGAAGLASALPALPTGYLKIDIGGTEFKVPYYAA